MPPSNSSQTALIVGASRGLGREVALKLAEQNYHLILSARSADGLADLITEIGKRGGEAKAFSADVRSKESVDNLYRFIDANFETLDLVINCAGIGIFGPLEEYSGAQIDQMLDTNLKGIIYSSQAAVARMKNVHKGHIVNVASSSGHTARPNETIYTASKFGVVGFTEALAAEVLKQGIVVTVFSPGGMNTSFWENNSAPHSNSTADFMDPEVVAKLLVDSLAASQGLALQVIRVARVSK